MTTTTILLLLGLFWAICGVFAYGLSFAYFQRKFLSSAEVNYKSDRNFALFCGLAGFSGLIGTLLCTGTKYGLKWK